VGGNVKNLTPKQQELDILKDRSSKLQKKNKRMEGRLASLERGLRHRQGQVL
jgi:hypothetical protein